MPAAAGDGLLGEPAAPGGGGGAEDAARPAAAGEGSFLPAWVSGVPRERLRDFQHHKRVGNYLIGSRKLGEGSFAKVREGLHVLTGEKVSRPGPGSGPELGGRGGRGGGELPRALRWESGCLSPSACLSSRVERGRAKRARRPRQLVYWPFPRGGLGPVLWGQKVGWRAASLLATPPRPFCFSKGAAWRSPARVGGGSGLGARRDGGLAERLDPGLRAWALLGGWESRSQSLQSEFPPILCSAKKRWGGAGPQGILHLRTGAAGEIFRAQRRVFTRPPFCFPI